MKIMSIQVKETEILKLFDRVYNNKSVETNDEIDLKEYCTRVFGDGSFNPDPSAVHQFNNLVVRKADEVAKPMVTDIVGLLANHRTEKRGTVIQYDLPMKRKARFVWSANGVGVDLIRVAGKKKEIAIPRTFNTGLYYEPEDLVQDSVQAFNDLVNNLAEAKVSLYLKEINKLIATAITGGGAIPSANIRSGVNLTLSTYNSLASVLGRYGGRPLFIADSLLIDHFAFKQATTEGVSNLLTDKYKNELLQALNITSIGRTNAFNLVNPFLDDSNSRVELPIDTGYMLAGEGKIKPFAIVEYGKLRQTTEVDFETERVMMKVFQDASINLVLPHVLGYIKDESIIFDTSSVTEPVDTPEELDAAVVAAITAIEALPNVGSVTIGDADDIEAARVLYNALTEDQKEEVGQIYAKLVAVEAELSGIKVFNIVEAILGLPAVDGIPSDEPDLQTLKDLVASIRADYDALSEIEKPMVPDAILALLVALETELE